jgi:hypothetical protein
VGGQPTKTFLYYSKPSKTVQNFPKKEIIILTILALTEFNTKKQAFNHKII